MRFLRVKRVDETGLERLKVTLQVIDADFQYFLATAEGLMVQANLMKEVKGMVEFCKERNQEASKRAMFVVDFLRTPIEELKDKIHTALLYTSLETVRDYLAI